MMSSTSSVSKMLLACATAISLGPAPNATIDTITATNQAAAPALLPPHRRPSIRISTTSTGEKARIQLRNVRFMLVYPN